MIADDHEVVRRGVRALLDAQPGWSVCGEAPSGREAVGMAASLHPDAAILDVSMPDLNGIDTAREIGKKSPSTGVVLYTMYQSEELAREAFRAGVIGYVLKTDRATELLDAVGCALRHVHFVSPRLCPVPKRSANPVPDAMRLTPREREIVQLIAEGKSNWCVAQILGISVKTVESHRFNVMQKLALSSVVDLVRYAVRNRLASI